MEQDLARFDRYLKRRFGNSSTPIHYLSDLKIFFSLIGKDSPENVTPQDVDTFIEGQIAAGRSSTTINRRLASIRSFFEFLAGEDPDHPWLNPVNTERHRLKLGFQLPRDVPDDEVAKLFSVISDERDRAMSGLMVGAGLRVGEVAKLRLEDIEGASRPDRMVKLLVRGKGNKERVVWLAESLWVTLQAWLNVRPNVETERIFLNFRGQPITVNGIQWCLSQHCKAADVTLSCHRLRHTFARRLAENGLSVDSLAKLLGHKQLQTTQRYIDGADPTVRADFAAAMEGLETNLIRDREAPAPEYKQSLSQPQHTRNAPESDLLKLHKRLENLPPWLQEAVGAYLNWRWTTWRGQTAYRLGRNFINLVQRIWSWLEINRQVCGWESFRREDLESWLRNRYQDGVSPTTIRNEVAQFRGLLRFLEVRDYEIDPGLFRVKLPKKSTDPLPRHLRETDYQWLETNILQATQDGTYDAYFDRAWFLTLANTGVRLSELLDLRLGDLNPEKGFATIRDGKPGRDRIVYLTPRLVNALQQYLQHRPETPSDDHVFLLRGRSPSARAIQRRLTKYGQQCGVSVSPHRLRHTLATRLINNGMPIHSLKKLLGHQHLDTTQVYARIYDETLYEQFTESMDRIESVPVPEQMEVATDEPAWFDTR